MDENYREYMADCFVRFSRNMHCWYSPNDLKHRWVEAEQAYILD